MPRNVRNFWIELDVDGSKSKVATGPQRADGGFQMTIKQRDFGDITNAVSIRGFVDSKGAIKLVVDWSDSQVYLDIHTGTFTIETKR